MKVEVLSATESPEVVCAAAMRSTRTKEPAEKLFMELTEKETAGLLRKARKMKHFGVFEHASFTVSVSGISRACTHQLVRHRLFSYLQTSSRQIDLSDVEFVVPPSCGSGAYRSIMEGHYRECLRVYKYLIGCGIPKEDARFVLPQATTQHIVITGNARQWLHFFWMRARPECKAQWEIKKMAQEIHFQLRTIAPTIFEELVEC